MEPLTPHARTLLDDAMEMDAPTEQDRVRVAQRIAAVTGMVIPSAALGSSAVGNGLVIAKTGSVAAKSFALFALVGAVGVVGVVAMPKHSGSVSRAMTEQVSRSPVVQSVASTPHNPTVNSAPSVVATTRVNAIPLVVTPVASHSDQVAPVRVRTVTRHVGQRVTRDDEESSRLAEETALLASARNALRSGDARASLRLVERYETEFSRGVLRAAATSLHRQALCALGRVEDARLLVHGASRVQGTLSSADTESVCGTEAP